MQIKTKFLYGLFKNYWFSQQIYLHVTIGNTNRYITESIDILQ